MLSHLLSKNGTQILQGADENWDVSELFLTPRPCYEKKLVTTGVLKLSIPKWTVIWRFTFLMLPKPLSLDLHTDRAEMIRGKRALLRLVDVFLANITSLSTQCLLIIKWFEGRRADHNCFAPSITSLIATSKCSVCLAPALENISCWHRLLLLSPQWG